MRRCSQVAAPAAPCLQVQRCLRLMGSSLWLRLLETPLQAAQMALVRRPVRGDGNPGTDRKSGEQRCRRCGRFGWAEVRMQA